MGYMVRLDPWEIKGGTSTVRPDIEHSVDDNNTMIKVTCTGASLETVSKVQEAAFQDFETF